MTVKQNSSLGIVFILGLLAMLMPLSIDMYLPALPVIAAQYNVPDGSAQMTLSTYILGFALGQLLYGPMADSLGRKPVILGGTLVFAAAAVACALSQTIDMLIVMRFFHGLAAAAARPWKKRMTMSISMVCDRAQATAAAANTSVPPRITGLRPRLSAIGPYSS